MKFRLITLFSIALASSANSQVYTKPETPTQSQPSSTQAPSNTVVNNTQETPSSPYGNEIPVFDPSNETITLFGQTYDLKDNRLGGQFEAYLASNAYTQESATTYRQVMGEILALISPTNPTGMDASVAFKLLHKASSYPGDANICDSLASSIYSVSLTFKSNSNQRDVIERLEKEKNRIINNLGVIQNNTDLTPARGEGEGQATPPPPSAKVQDYQKRIIEIETLKKKFQGDETVSLVQSKIQYQAMMVQLFTQRRFEHVLIAARFYNHIFSDGDDRLHLEKNSQTANFFLFSRLFPLRIS